MLTDAGQAGTKVWICTNVNCTNVKPIFCQTQCCVQLKSNEMATIYKVELVSHWTNYSIEQMQKILEDALKKSEREKGNTITVEVKSRQ
jgi:hypothetical protein